ncbi:MAG TPA: magnesium/cobalt transporter CorA [Polyangiaceae bacterium]|mgnify:CR=1 FL=1|nr:magnesium/cobalt transporter CorA [Polyangiaceae bacterium]
MAHGRSRLPLARRLLAARSRRRAPPRAESPSRSPRAPTITAFGYGPEAREERVLASLSELEPLLGRWPVLWVDVDGTPSSAELERLGSLLGLHPLALEDAARGDQRPKVELYPEHWFMVLRMLSLGEALGTEQLSILLTRDVVVTLQAGTPGDSLDAVRARLRAPRSRLHTRGADYLAYALVDAVVDHYFPVLEAFGERLEALEEQVLSRVSKGHASEIQAAKHDLFTARRALWPMRDAIGTAYREDCPFLTPETQLYLRDVYDHTSQLGDVLDTYREVTSGLMEIHLSAMSNRMNEIMKVLTVVSTVFIPLTFIAGVYGMNFNPDRSPLNMPEIEWYFGYPWALGLMAVTALGLVLFFRSKRYFD